MGGKLPSISTRALAGRKGSRGCSSLFIELIVEIYEVQFIGGARQRRVEPAEHVARHGLVAEQAAVDENGLPLPALGLMARHGIGEFHLERVEMRVLADLLEALDFTFDVEVVLLDLVEKARGLLAGQRRGFRGDRVEQYPAFDLRIFVVITWNI